MYFINGKKNLLIEILKLGFLFFFLGLSFDKSLRLVSQSKEDRLTSKGTVDHEEFVDVTCVETLRDTPTLRSHPHPKEGLQVLHIVGQGTGFGYRRDSGPTIADR